MMTVFFSFFALLFILGAFLFGCGKLLCIVGILVCAAAALLPRILGGKLSPKALKAASCAAIVCICLLAVMTGMAKTDKPGTIGDYNSRLSEAGQLLNDQKYDELDEALSSLDSEYGESDDVTMLRYYACLAQEDFADARNQLGYLTNTDSQEYYLIMEATYLGEGNDENSDALSRLYLKAADSHPQWVYMQKMAGLSLLCDEEPRQAEYYLLRAYEMDDGSDQQIPYLLGRAYFDQNLFTQSAPYFVEAVEAEPDENTLAEIAWYWNELVKMEVVQ